jgi:hypothetical protein
MTKRSAALVVVLAGLALAACGSSHHPAAPPSTQTTPSPIAVAPNPCTLLTPSEVAHILAAKNPRPIRLGSHCSYAYGPRGVLVIAMPATSVARAAVAKPRPGAIALRAAGAHGYVQTIKPISTASTGQAAATLVKSATFLEVVLTDPSLSPSALLTAVSRLGRSAAARL